MITLNRILCPTDLSEESKRALDYAVELGKNSNAEIILLYVQTLIIPRYPSGDPAQYLEDEEKRAAEQLEILADKYRKAYPGITTAIVRNFISDGILQQAKDLKADVIVMASHGRTGLKRLLMGSIAEVVLREARCPVIIVRIPHHAPEPESDDEEDDE